MRRSKLLVTGPLVLVLAASLLAPAPLEAQFNVVDSYFSQFNRQASGVYLVLGQAPPAPPFFLIFNVYREGMFSASAQVQGTTLSGTAFIDDQGVWKRTGPNQITARLLSFNFLPPGSVGIGGSEGGSTGIPHSNAIADVVMDIADDFNSVSGTFSISVFPVDVNPVAPDAVPLAPPNVILFEGQRLTVPD